MASNQDIIARQSVRAAAILTTGYVAGTVLSDCGLMNQLVLLINFTIGQLTDMSIKIEFSDDNSTWYQETTNSISAGVCTESAASHKYSATGKYRLPVEIKDRFIRVSAIGNGTVTDSTLTIDAVLGVA